MYIIVKHFSTGKCQVLPVIFKTEKEGKEHLLFLCEKEKNGGYSGSFIGHQGDSVIVMKEGADCFDKEYILQKLTFSASIYAEAVPLHNHCGRMA